MMREHKDTVGSERGGVAISPAKHVQEDLLRCHICRLPYEALARKPKTLKCSHTFCHLCISHNSQQKKRSSSKVRFGCPQCRKDISLPKGGVEELPDNTTVLGLLDIVNKAQPPTRSASVFCAPQTIETQTGETLDRLALAERSRSRHAEGEARVEVQQRAGNMDAAFRHTEKHAEAMRSGPQVLTNSHLYPTLRQVRFEDPPADDEENQPPPYSTLDPVNSKAAEAAASAHVQPPSFGGLYPHLAGEHVPIRSSPGVPLPGMTNASQSMRVMSPGQSTLNRRLGGSLRFPSNPDVSCSADANGATRCTPVEPLDLAIPLAGGAGRQVILNNRGGTASTASRGNAPHIVLNIAQRSGSARPQQQGMAQRQVVFMDNTGAAHCRPTVTPSPEYRSAQPSVQASSQAHNHRSVMSVNQGYAAYNGAANSFSTTACSYSSPANSFTATANNYHQHTSPASNFTPPASNFPPQTGNYPPPASNYPPPASNFPPQSSNFPPPASNFPPQSSNFPPPASNFPPQSSNFPPPASNFPPQSSNFPSPASNLTTQTSNFPPPVSIFGPPGHYPSPPTPASSSYTPPASMSSPPSNPLVPGGCSFNSTADPPTQIGCSLNPPPTDVTPKKVTMNVPEEPGPTEYSHSPLQLVKKFGSYCERTPQPGAFQLPSQISVCDNGEILVVDTNLMAMQLFNAQGDQVFQMKVVGLQSACMIAGDKIAVGTHRGLEIYSRQGKLLQEFQIGPIIMVRAYGSGVLVVQAKCITGYMGAELKATQQIRKRTKGSLVRTSSSFQRLADIAVNANKELVVLDAGAGEIYILTEDGHTRQTMCPTSQPCGRLLHPTSLAVDSHNNIYVCDTGNRRVLKFGPTGDFARSLVNFTLGATSTSPSIENTLTAYGVAVNNSTGDLLLTVTAGKMAQVRIYKL